MNDKSYLKVLSKGLGIKEEKSLSLIMGPEELKKTLQGLTYSDFDNGIRLISLHNHTTVSDGRVSPENYLDNALAFKKKYGYRDLLLAITDHDDIAGLATVLQIAQQNPEKYKGIRIVLGCELSVSYMDDSLIRPIDFEILHYGVNPFDKYYMQWLSNIREARQKALPKIFKFFQKKYPSAHISLDEFLTQHPLMKKGFGCYLAYITPRYLCQKINDATQNRFVWDYFRCLGTSLSDNKIPFWHTLDELIVNFKKHGFGFLSVAHPYRINLEGKFYGDGPLFLKHLFGTLKQKGVEGLEVYYMNLRRPLSNSFDSILSGNLPISDTDRWVQSILDFADKNDMIKTGGTDSHTPFLAGRKKQIVAELSGLLDRYKPIIRQGYKVLKKEVVLGLPSPCMPAKSMYENTGIGSAYGAGAERIGQFFGGIFDKIQLGPMGKTIAKTGHSPYMCENKPNPFSIPLEYLVDDGYLTQAELSEIYDSPKQDTCIDYFNVSKTYDKALHLAWKNSKSDKSFSEFWQNLANYYAQKAQLLYIADLQVQIPVDTKGLKSEMFLTDYTLGSPPDVCSKEMQLWHFPVFDPKQIFDKKGNLGPAGQILYRYIYQTMRNAKGGLRIDHFIGFVNPFVISEKDPTVFGRLYSSPDNPDLAPYLKTDFTDITRKIILKAAAENGFSSRDIYAEDIGSRPEQLDKVMTKCGLGRLLVAEFVEPNNWNHLYHLATANPLDVAVLDTHDTPSIQEFFTKLPEDKKAQFAWLLSSDLRFNYNDDLKSVKQLIRMQWGALLASPAERVGAFFTSWTGQKGRYNEPGNKNQWRLRCAVDFEYLYFKNLAQGISYNPFDAIALAIYSRGDEFYHQNEELVHQLRAAETEILTLAQEL